MTKITVPYGYKSFESLQVGTFFQHDGNIYIKIDPVLSYTTIREPVVNAVNLCTGKMAHMEKTDSCFVVKKMAIDVENQEE